MTPGGGGPGPGSGGQDKGIDLEIIGAQAEGIFGEKFVQTIHVSVRYLGGVPLSKL
jgi:hypothetical protein